MTRFYDLENTGRVKGSYANPQPDKNLYPLDDAPNEQSKRNGVPGSLWVPDEVMVNAQTSQVALTTAKNQSIADNLPSWQNVSDAIDAANTLAKLQAIVKKLARVTYWLAKNSET
jgi:hypothetical protein